MRHLASPRDIEDDLKTEECDLEIKDEDLEDFDIKTDLMELPLVALETEDFQNYDQQNLVNEAEFDETLNYGLLKLSQTNNKKNRRKSLQPQRATLSDPLAIDINESMEPSLMNDIEEDIITKMEEEEELEEGEDDKEVDNDQNIFKGLQEEADVEDLDTEMQKTVREEWKAHWGVKCNMCEQVFTSKSIFDKHYRLSYNTCPVYTCSYCNKTMDKYSTFRSHCYRHITEGRYKCEKCNKGFSLQSMLHIHTLSKHTDNKPYICEECGKGFVTKPGLKIHLKKHKSGEKEKFPCVECGKILHTRGGLTAHMNVHRLGRRFMCDMCGKTFTQKVNMQQHVKHHNGERPHSCDKCGKSFAEKSHLARHYSFHSEKRPYKCEICQKMYKTERCLKVHSMVHASSRPYVCSYCSKGFLSSTKLKQHYNVHTGERPFKCKYCERTFTNYPNWLKHTRRRHKVDHKTGDNLQVIPKEEEIPSTTITFYTPYDEPNLGSYINGVDIQNNITLPPFSQQFEGIESHISFDPNIVLPNIIQVQIPQLSQLQM